MNPWLKTSLPIVVLLLLWLIAWAGVLSGDSVLYMRDLTFFALPMKKVWLAAVQAGHWPLWTPFISDGLPFLADLSQQALYPLNVVFLAGWPLHYSLNVFLALHQGLAMLMGWVLLRVLGIRPWLAVWGAVIYGFSGYVLSITDNVNYLPAVAWLPAAIAGWTIALKTRQWWAAALSAIALMLMITGGDALMSTVFGVWAAGTWLYSLIDHNRQAETRSHRQTVWRQHLMLAANLGGWTLALSAAQLLPTLEMLALSVRQNALNLRETLEWSFPPQRLMEFVVPYFYGTKYPMHGFIGQFLYPRFREPWVNSIYVGMLPMLLAGWAVVNRTTRRWAWIALVAICLFFSFGEFLPGYEIIFKVFTLLNSHRYMEKLLLPVTLGLVVLGTLGAQTLWERRFDLPALWDRHPGWQKGLFALVLLSAGMLGLVLIPAEAWIWPHLNERAFEWLNTQGVDRARHIGGLFWHTGLWLVAVLLWALLPRQVPARLAGHLNETTLRQVKHWGLIALLVFAGMDSWWVNGSSVVTDKTAVFHTDQPPTVVAILNQWKAHHPERGPVRVFYDDTQEVPEYYGQQSLIEEISQARGSQSVLSLPEVYWSYRVRYNLERGLFNGGVLHDIRYENGRFSPLHPARHHRMDQALMKDNQATLMRFTGVTHVLGTVQPDNKQLDNPRDFRLIGAAPEWNLRVFEVVNPLPRAYLAPNEIRNQDPLVFGFFSREMRAPRHQVEVSLPPDPDHPKQPWVTPQPYRIRQTSDEPGHLVFSVDNPYPIGAWLTVLESWFPGWEATVNGQAATPVLANHRMMAVRVPQGEHRVELTYRSHWFEQGLMISGLAWLALLAGLMTLLSKRRRANKV